MDGHHEGALFLPIRRSDGRDLRSSQSAGKSHQRSRYKKALTVYCFARAGDPSAGASNSSGPRIGRHDAPE